MYELNFTDEKFEYWLLLSEPKVMFKENSDSLYIAVYSPFDVHSEICTGKNF